MPAAVLLVSGCAGGAQQETVADTTVVEVLVELHLANARIEVTDQPLPVTRDSIFAAYGIDSASYAEALAYYAEHPEEYSRIYGRVLDRLSAERLPLGGPNRTDISTDEVGRRPAGRDSSQN